MTTQTAVPSSAEEITRASKSNLALAFFALSKERQQDISVFYAWCRVIDDIADDPGPTPAERTHAFNIWREALRAPTEGESTLAPAVRELIEKYRLSLAHFDEIIAGCEMDVAETVYRTWEDLELYCYRVASVVGLISIEIFGYQDPACKEYARQLGLALQLTNIIRDVGVDWKNGGRIYLPEIEMESFGCTIAILKKGRTHPALHALLEYQAKRARELYARAIAALPKDERRSMIAAEIMRTVYTRLLTKMRADGFHVLERRYRLNALQKGWCIVRVLVRTWWSELVAKVVRWWKAKRR